MEQQLRDTGDLGLAVRWETERLLREAKGDRNKAVEMAYAQYMSEGLVSEEELERLLHVLRISTQAQAGELSAETAYVEARRVHYEILASADPSPVALAIASTSASSYLVVEDGYGKDDEPQVVFAKKRGTWEDVGGAIGGLLGNKLGGPLGAVMGYKIGSAVGGAVDDCLNGDDGNGGGAPE